MFHKYSVCCIGLFVSQSVFSDTLLVPQEYKTIQMATDSANANDTVLIAAGTFYEAVTLYDKAITLTGTLDTDGTHLTHLYPAVSISNPAITFMYVASDVVVKDLKITGFAGNNSTSTQGGGMYFVDSQGTVENCHFYQCQATSSGGAVACRLYTETAIPSFTDCTFESNDGVEGGAIYFDLNYGPSEGTPIPLTDCIFSGNIAQYGSGGGIWVESEFGSPTDILLDIDGCSFIANTAFDGFGHSIKNYGVASMNIQGSNFCGSDDEISGTWIDLGDNSFSESCTAACEGDLDENGTVAIGDLLILIGEWGATDSDADLNNDGIVNIHDMLALISNWGVCE